MNTPQIPGLRSLLFPRLAFLMMILLPVGGQAQTSGFARDLGALETKYKADKDAQAAARDQLLATAQKAYEAALDDAEQKYTVAGKTNEVQAIMDEKKRLVAGKLGPAAPPLLPKTLNPARGAYQREGEKASHDYITRTKQLSEEYLRALGAIESSARLNKQDTLLQQVAVLKRELLGGASGAAPGPAMVPVTTTGTNLMTNADFSEKGKDDVPAKWSRVGPATFAVITEAGATFVRVTSTADKPQTAIRQDIDRPPGSRELAISVKIRCPAMKGHGKFGIDCAQRTATDLVTQQDPFPAATDENRNWKQFSGILKLDPTTTKIVFRLFVVGAIASVDFKDLHVEAR